MDGWMDRPEIRKPTKYIFFLSLSRALDPTFPSVAYVYVHILCFSFFFFRYNHQR